MINPHTRSYPGGASYPGDASGRGEVSGIRRTLSDLIELVQLQFRLTMIDSQEAVRRGLTSLVLACVAIAVAISALTTLMMGIGWLITELTGFVLGGSLIIVAVIGVVVTVLILLAAYSSLKRAAGCLRESTSELGESIEWMRDTLTTSSDRVATDTSSRLYGNGQGRPYATSGENRR